MNKLDKGQLTPKLRSFIEDYLDVNFKHIPTEISLLNCLVHFSRLICTRRVEVESLIVRGASNSTPCNLYAMILAKSGGYKDVTYRSTEHVIMGKSLVAIEDEYEQKRADYITRLQKEADDLNLDKKEREKYVSVRIPKSYIKDISKSTFEGFNSAMYSNYAVGIGCTFFRHSEFADILLSKNTDDQSLLLSLKEAFDGRVHNKIIKGENMSFDIDKVPTVVLVYSVYDKLIDGDGKVSIDNSFSGGMARRFLMTFIPRKIEPVEETLEDAERIRKVESFVKGKFSNTFESMKKMESNIICSREADVELLNYKNDCTRRAFEIDNDDILSDQISGRFWIALKLSGIISAFEKPVGKRMVTLEHMKTAIYLVEYFGTQFQSFRSIKPKGDWELLFNVLLDNLGVSMRKVDIMKSLGKDHHNFKQWFDENIEFVSEYVDDTQYELIIENDGRNHKPTYTLVDGTSLVKKSPIKYGENIPVMVSGIGIDKIDHGKGNLTKLCAVHKANTTYEKITVKWNDLHKVVTNDSFMPQLNTGTRSKSGYELVPGGVLMVFDIDNKLTLDEGKKFFKKLGIKSLVITSMSHQSEFTKDDKPGATPKDKYHVLALLSTPFTGTSEQWKEVYIKISNDMGIDIDPACKNVSRFFYPSVWEDSEYEYIDGEGLDWESYLSPTEPVRRPMIVKTDGDVIASFGAYDNVDYYTRQELGVLVVNEGEVVNGNSGTGISGRNDYLNKIWFTQNKAGGVGRAEKAVRYANHTYCNPVFSDQYIDEFLKGKK